ncbi:MAG: hypothetical protein E7112_00805 [Bacteroidales bacterium]|nr:hypothetical protein [Bacteroidales bacterium]
MFEATKDQIQEWKKKHGVTDIIVYEVDDFRGYFRKPTRQELSYAAVASNQMKDAVKYSDVLMNSCWLGGDREIIERDEYFLGASPLIEALSEAKTGEIKKL